MIDIFTNWKKSNLGLFMILNIIQISEHWFLSKFLERLSTVSEGLCSFNSPIVGQKASK